jgi:hypothetical protein
MSKWVTIVRVMLAGGLLMEVWLHSHWSVALCLTLLFAASEISAVVANLRRTSGVDRVEFEDNLIRALQKYGKAQ